jgi:hypothetical protein
LSVTLYNKQFEESFLVIIELFQQNKDVNRLLV